MRALQDDQRHMASIFMRAHQIENTAHKMQGLTF